MAQQSVEAITSQSTHLELHLILKLFAKLTDGHAANGQDLLRVIINREQVLDVDNMDTPMDDSDSINILELTCQIMDTLSQATQPLLELLGEYHVDC